MGQHFVIPFLQSSEPPKALTAWAVETRDLVPRLCLQLFSQALPGNPWKAALLLLHRSVKQPTALLSIHSQAEPVNVEIPFLPSFRTAESLDGFRYD